MKKRLLLVDDESVCVTFLSLALSEEGFDVRSAQKSSDALQIAAEFEPEILISDWMLKDDQDGIELAKAMRQARPDLFVIFITGMAKEIVEPKMAEVPGSLVVIKPIELDEILALLSVFRTPG